MKIKWEHIAGQWQLFSGIAKKKWSQLTDDELTKVNGNRNALAIVIQKRYFVSKKAAHTQIDSWLEKLQA